MKGGGIFVDLGTTLELTNSIVTENKSRQFGGGITNEGSLRVVRSIIRDNTLPLALLGGATSSGGGIFNFQGASVTIIESTVSGNEAARGAGIRNDAGTLKIIKQHHQW